MSQTILMTWRTMANNPRRKYQPADVDDDMVEEVIMEKGRDEREITTF